MEINQSTHQGIAVFTLVGDIDGKTAGPTQAEILPKIEPGAALLDMTGVGYMSSAGLRMLLLLYRQATAKGCKIALVGLTDEIKDTMAATGFIEYFVVANSLAEGLEALQ